MPLGNASQPTVMRFIESLELVPVAGIAKVSPAAEGPPFPLGALALLPKGTKGALSQKVVGVLYLDVGDFQRAGVKRVLAAVKITAIAADPAANAQRAHLAVKVTINLFQLGADLGGKAFHLDSHG